MAIAGDREARPRERGLTEMRERLGKRERDESERSTALGLFRVLLTKNGESNASFEQQLEA